MSFDFTTLTNGVKILNTTPVGDGGLVLNQNFAPLDALLGNYTAHAAAQSGVHGATSAATASRLVERDGSGGAAFTALTASSITDSISVQNVLVAAAGVVIGTRSEINFVEGENVTLTVTDDAVNGRVNVEIASTGGGGGPGATSLNELSDVMVGSPTTGQVLRYNGSQWVNAAVAQSDVTGLTTALAAKADDSALTAHTSDATIHRSINDAGTSSTVLWSAQKIIAALSAKADATTGVLTATGTSPITLSFSSNALTASIAAASGSTAGSMSSAHYTMLANATSAATASRLVLRDGSGGAAFGAITATSISDNISVQKHEIAKGGTLVGTRKRLNLIEGSNVSLTVTDNSANDRVDVTITATPGSTVATLNDLTDVTILSATTGQVLRYNGGQWVNATLTTAEVLPSTTGHSGKYLTNNGTGGFSWASVTAGVSAASNVGLTGVGVFKQNNSGTLEFKNVEAGSSKVTVADDLLDDTVVIDVDPTQIDHDDLVGVGTYSHPQIDVILADLAPSDAATLQGMNLTVSGQTKYTGLLSAGASNYKPGHPAGTSVNYISNDVTFTLASTNTSTSVNAGDTGVLRLYVNGVEVDSFDLGAAFDESERNGNQSYTGTSAGTSAGGRITINSVGKYNNFRAYQKLVFTINLIPSLFVDGYNSVYVVHDLSTDQTSATYEVFYDSDTNGISVGTTTVTLGTQTSSKYLSGVRYLSTGDTISVGTQGTGLFRNVYSANPMSLSGFTGVPTATISPTDSSVSGLSNPPSRLETMTVTGKTLTLSTASVCSNNARITATGTTPYSQSASSQSSASNILVSTYADGSGGVSTDQNEYFCDEYYRLPLSFNSDSTSATAVGQWTSSTALGSTDAQCYFDATGTAHALVYPSINFTTGYSPTQTANYSGRSSPQQYLRAFFPSTNKTGITLTFAGVSAGIDVVGSGDINVEVKLPTQTGWLDAAVAYSSGAGVGSDGLGCLSGSISYAGGNAAMTLTFGGKTTGDAGGRMYIRVTLRNSTRTIKQITTNW